MNESICKLEGYKILGEIGKGSFSRIYKAIHVETNKYYAIKVIDNAKKYEKILVKEVEILASLNHKNIIQLKECITQDNIKYIVLEYCERGDLKNYIMKKKDNTGNVYNKLMTMSSIDTITKQIADGIEYLHTNNIIHRDLKPANILMTSDGTIKIADLGFAKEIETDALSKTLCGSPLYMAPEVLNSEDYTAKADLWSIGIMYYQFIYGITPYKARNPIELSNIYKNPKIEIKFPDSMRTREIKKSGLYDLIKKLIIIDPEKRITFENYFHHNYFRINEMQLRIEKLPINIIHNYKPFSPKIKKPVTFKELTESITDDFQPKKYILNKKIFKRSLTKTFIPISGSTSIPEVLTLMKNPQSQSQVSSKIVNLEDIGKKIMYYMYVKGEPEKKICIILHFNRLVMELSQSNFDSELECLDNLRKLFKEFTRIGKIELEKIHKESFNTLEVIYKTALETARTACVTELLKFYDSSLRSYQIALGLFKLLEIHIGKSLEIDHYLNCIESRIISIKKIIL